MSDVFFISILVTVFVILVLFPLVYGILEYYEMQRIEDDISLARMEYRASVEKEEKDILLQLCEKAVAEAEG